MESSYLIIDGKRIELPTETVLNIKKALKFISPLLELQSMLTEHVYIKNEYSSFSERSLYETDEKYIQVYLPPANAQWYFLVMDTIKKFCAARSERWPVGGTMKTRDNYVTIHTEDTKSYAPENL